MIFSVLMIVFVLAVAYFHWVQGVFSAAISMVLAIVAGTLAVGMHESLATGLLGGAMADYANAMMMGVTFAVVYGIGRILFDMFVPGNVRVPLAFDKVGGLICGLIAGIFGVGTIAVAAQQMPLGATVLGFARYPLAEEKTVAIAGERSRQVDALVSGTLDIEGDAPIPAEDRRAELIMPVDRWLLEFANMQSRSGALNGSRDYDADHPDLLRELFFARVGLETGAKHSALNGIGGKTHFTFQNAFAPSSLNQTEGEVAAIRARNLPKQISADPTKPGKFLLVLRVSFDRSATDKDGKLRFSTGNVRLVADGREFFPIGTMTYPGNLMLANRIDDILLAEAPQGGTPTIDFVFEIDQRDAVAVAAGDALKFKPGTYAEVKRYARLDLSDKPVTLGPPTPAPANAVERRPALTDEIAKRVGQAAPTR